MKGSYSPARGLLEADVSQQVKDFMEWRGWRAKRQNVTKVPDGTGRWIHFNEPGVADFLFIKYLSTELTGLSVTCWVEMKRERGGRLAEDQKKWRDREVSRGAVVLKANDIRQFHSEYDHLFGWLQTEEWVRGGQREIGFDATR